MFWLSDLPASYRTSAAARRRSAASCHHGSEDSLGRCHLRERRGRRSAAEEESIERSRRAGGRIAQWTGLPGLSLPTSSLLFNPDAFSSPRTSWPRPAPKMSKRREQFDVGGGHYSKRSNKSITPIWVREAREKGVTAQQVNMGAMDVQDILASNQRAFAARFASRSSAGSSEWGHDDDDSDDAYVADSPTGSERTRKTRRSSKKHLGRGRWTKEEDERLRECVREFGRDFGKIAQHMGNGRTETQCMQRWRKVLEPGLVRGPWTKEEDDMIKRCIEEGVMKWSEIAERIPGRIGKQCRERWFNHLDPSLKKGGWTEQEDAILVEAQGKWGNSWTKIARLLPGRSENAVKNRWNSATRRRHKQNQSGAGPYVGAAARAKAALVVDAAEENGLLDDLNISIHPGMIRAKQLAEEARKRGEPYVDPFEEARKAMRVNTRRAQTRVESPGPSAEGYYRGGASQPQPDVAGAGNYNVDVDLDMFDLNSDPFDVGVEAYQAPARRSQRSQSVIEVSEPNVKIEPRRRANSATDEHDKSVSGATMESVFGPAYSALTEREQELMRSAYLAGVSKQEDPSEAPLASESQVVEEGWMPENRKGASWASERFVVADLETLAYKRKMAGEARLEDKAGEVPEDKMGLPDDNEEDNLSLSTSFLNMSLDKDNFLEDVAALSKSLPQAALDALTDEADGVIDDEMNNADLALLEQSSGGEDLLSPLAQYLTREALQVTNPSTSDDPNSEKPKDVRDIGGSDCKGDQSAATLSATQEQQRRYYHMVRHLNGNAGADRNAQSKQPMRVRTSTSFARQVPTQTALNAAVHHAQHNLVNFPAGSTPSTQELLLMYRSLQEKSGNPECLSQMRSKIGRVSPDIRSTVNFPTTASPMLHSSRVNIPMSVQQMVSAPMFSAQAQTLHPSPISQNLGFITASNNLSATDLRAQSPPVPGAQATTQSDYRERRDSTADSSELVQSPNILWTMRPGNS